MTKVEKIAKALKYDCSYRSYETRNIVTAWNEFSDSRDCYDDFIYYMYDFDSDMSMKYPSDIAYMVWNSRHFDPFERCYAILNEDEIVTFNYLDDENCFIDFEGLAEFMVKNHDAYGIEDIQKILDKN